MLAETRTVETLVDGLRRLAPHPISARELVEALYPAGDPLGELGDPRDGYPDIPLEGGGLGALTGEFDRLRRVLERATRARSGAAPDARRVGKLLRSVQGRVVGGWTVQRHQGPEHTALWGAAETGGVRAEHSSTNTYG